MLCMCRIVLPILETITILFITQSVSYLVTQNDIGNAKLLGKNIQKYQNFMHMPTIIMYQIIKAFSIVETL